jgi:hypothetical protein
MRTIKCFFFSGVFVILLAVFPAYILVNLTVSFLISATDEKLPILWFFIAFICSIIFFILAIDQCDKLNFLVRRFFCRSKIWDWFCSDAQRLKLAEAYYNGVGTPRTPEAAFELFQQIADSPKSSPKVTHSQYRLGVMAMEGDGCPLNLEQAKIWLREVRFNSIKLKPVPVDIDLVKNFIEQPKPDYFFNKEKRNHLSEQCRNLLNCYLSNKNQYFLKAEKKLEEIETMEQAEHRKEITKTKKNAQEEANRQMLSYLTHTLRNSLGTGPETIRQTIRLLQGEYRKDMPHYKAINNMVSLLTTFLLIETMLETFKQYISEPKAFQSAWQQDNQGRGSIELVTAFALRQALSRLLFQLHEKLEDLLLTDTNWNLKDLRDSFMTNVVMLELNPERTGQVFAWLKQHLDILELDLESSQKIHFGENKTRFNLLFSVISELLFNAFKYSDGQRRIELTFQTDANHHCLICRNHFNPDLRYQEQGSQKGLDFIKKLMDLLIDSRVELDEDDHVFTVKLFFSVDVFQEGYENKGNHPVAPTCK